MLDDFLFGNIGKKIKKWAMIIFVVGAIITIIIGFMLIAYSEGRSLVGLLVMIGGPIVALLSSWPLYGLGELIDKACSIDSTLRDLAHCIDAKQHYFEREREEYKKSQEEVEMQNEIGQFVQVVAPQIGPKE